jgi:soluble lytic murein transglycosylase-like protein
LRGGIEFGAALYRAWAAAGEQRDLTFGSYNAGLGNVQKAVALAGAASWGAAAALLVRLTGRHAAETTVYVRGIKRTYLGLR